MIQSITLTPAESHLLKIAEERHRSALERSKMKLEGALKSIWASKGWDWGTMKGQLQRDPLDPGIVRFVYDDGQPLPPTNTVQPPPPLEIVDFTAEVA